jgi:GT2 family glycosyltransferase
MVMLTFNQRETTLRALESLAPDDWSVCRVLLWDNGSTDGTADAVRTRFPAVHVHWHETNLGVASGRNAAAALAKQLFAPTHLLFADNDLVFTKGFVSALIEPFFADACVGQTQAKLRFLRQPDVLNDGGGCELSFWRGRTQPVGLGEVDRGQRDVQKPCISCGGAMMVRVDVFDELSGFDPVFDPAGPEDVDFSLRLQKRGYRALYVPRAMAFHEGNHTFGSGYPPPYARVKAQHWMCFLRRHGSLPQQVAFVLLGAPVIVLRMAVREARRGNLPALPAALRGAIGALRRTAPEP